MLPRELLPSRAFVIETSWAPDVTAIELQKRIGPRRFFGNGKLPFLGAAESPGAFRFSPRGRSMSRNSFRPVIHAVVEPSGHQGARVRITMGLNPFVMAFAVVWMTGMTLGSLVAAVTGLVQGQPVALLGLALPLLGVALVSFAFGSEAESAEHALREIYASAPPQPQVGAYR